MALHMVIIAMMAIRVLAQLLQQLLDCPVEFAVKRTAAKMPELERGAMRPVLRLRHVSAVARQLYCRLALLSQSPVMSPGAWAELQRHTSNARSRAVSVRVCMGVWVWVWVWVWVCVCVFTYTYTYIYKYMYMYMYTYKYKYTHTYIYVFML
jgi:hypothetical protein